MIMARTLAGHDKGKLYYVLEEDEKSAVLVNGTTRKLANPKTKSIKHLQPIKKLPAKVEEERSEIRTLTDERIAHLIKTYEGMISHEEEEN